MLCSDPFMSGAVPLGCGKCVHCRTNRARLWSWRQYIEYLTSDGASFITLTYDEEHLPDGGTLVPRDMQLWLKRFRKVCPVRVRYFLVGEYGEGNGRPHYHVSLFGLPWSSGFKGKSLSDWVRDTWGRGRVLVGEFNIRTAHYVTGYLTKGLRDQVQGRKFDVPEFTRMSTRPGIGSYGVRILAASLSGTDEGREGDVPYVLRSGGKRIPLGRYLFAGLVRELGVVEENAWNADDRSWERSWELLSLWRADETIPSLKKVYLDQIAGRLRNAEARYKIFQKQESL